MIGSPTPMDFGTKSLLGGPTDSLMLRVRGTDHDGQLIRIDANKCTIGSADTCGLRLRMSGVDPLHCLIIRGESGTAVRRWAADTRLNGATFDQAWLNPGDRLTVGSIEFDVLDETHWEANEADVLRISDASIAGDFDALIARIEELHDQLSAQSEQVALIEEAQRSFQSEAENLAASWERLQQQLDDKRAHDDDQRQHQTELKDMQEQLRSGTQSFEKRLADGNAFHRSVSQRLQQLRHHWEERRDDYVEETPQDASSPAADVPHAEHAAPQGDYSKLRDGLESLAAKMGHIEATSCSSEELWVAQRWASGVVEAALSRCADQIGELATQLEEHKSQVADQQLAWQEELTRLEDRITSRSDEAIERIASELASSNTAHDERLAGADCQIESLQQFAQQLNYRIEAIESEDRGFGDIELLDDRRVSSGQLDDGSWRDELQSLRQLTQQLSAQVEAVESQQQGLVESQSEADCQLESLNQLAERLEDKMETAEAKSRELSASDCHIESLHQFAEQLEDRINSLESRAASPQALADPSTSEQLDSLLSRTQELEAKVEGVKASQPTGDSEHHAADGSALQSQMEEMSEGLELLKSQLQQSLGRRSEFSTLDELAQLRTQLDESHRELSERIERRSERDDDDDRLGEQIDSASDRLAELSTVAETLYERIGALETQQCESDRRRDETDSRNGAWLEERFAELVQRHNDALTENSRRVEAELAQLTEMKEAFERAMAAPVEQRTERFADGPSWQGESSQQAREDSPEPASAPVPNATQDWQPAPILVEPKSSAVNTDPLPLAPEEVHFSQSSDEAPASVMDALAKFGQTDGRQAEQPESVDSTMVFSPAGNPSLPDSPLATSEPRRDAELAVADDATADDDESIEDYMSQLLKRVRGESQTSQDHYSASQALPPEPVIEAKPTPEAAAALEPQEEMEEQGEFVPRSQAPELSSNMAAMRELANESARAAISTSANRRNKFKAGASGIIAGVFGIGGAGLLYASQTAGQVALFTAWGCFAIGAYAGVRALLLRVRSGAPRSASTREDAGKETE